MSLDKLKKVITIKEISRSLREYSRDWDWVEDNRVELTMLYPDHYIAVKNKAVHYTESGMESICMIMELGGDDPAYWVVAYMNVKPIHFILATKKRERSRLELKVIK